MDVRNVAGTGRPSGGRRGAMLTMVGLGAAVALLGMVAAALLWPGGWAAAGDVQVVTLGAHMSGIPLEINHQGVVMVRNRLFDGTGAFRFALVDQSTGELLWTNDGTIVSVPPDPDMPGADILIEVNKGVYSVRLGKDDPPNMTPIPLDVFQSHEDVALRIWFDDLKGDGIHQLEPDHVLTSVPYAYHAAHATVADSVPGDGIPPGLIAMWHGTIGEIPEGWALCDGNDGRPDLRDKFIVGATQDDQGVAKTNVKGSLMVTGGEHQHTLTISEMPRHSHDYVGIPHGPDRISLGVDRWFGQQTYGTSQAGGDEPHENCPPFYALVFIIKL